MSVLYVVATPIGNLSDMCERALEVLRNVKYILAEDTRHTSILLRHFKITSPMISMHKFNEFSKSEIILEKILKEDCDAALVSDAGTPCISDPGSLLVRTAHQKGIKVTGIPGACAITAALSISGFDAGKFSFTGFFPRTKKEKEETINLMLNSIIDIFVIYESPMRLIDTLTYLLEYFPNGECVICNDLTKLYEKTLKGFLRYILPVLASDPNVNKGEYVIVFKKNMSCEKKQDDDLSLEAKIMDYISKNNVSLKTAVKKLAEEGADSKKSLYSASLRIKSLINNIPDD